MPIHNLIQLKADEDVLQEIRQHPLTHWREIMVFFIWFIAPFFFLFPLWQAGASGIFVFFFLAISSLFYGLRAFRKWKNTIFVVTDYRIVDLDQRGLLERVVSEIPLTKITDVSYRIKGFFPTLLHYGTLRVSTQGSSADIEFRRLPHPALTHDLLQDLRLEAVRVHPIQNFYDDKSA